MLSPNDYCAKGRRLLKHLLEDDIRPVFELLQKTLFGVDDNYLSSSLQNDNIVMTVACISEAVLTVSGDKSLSFVLVTQVVGGVRSHHIGE